MSHERPGYINVDELMPQVGLEQIAVYYGVPMGDVHHVGAEIRTRCFLNCGYDGQTGDRALAIKAEDPVKRWRCHQYGCGKGGNLVSLCDLLRPGTSAEGRPRGQRFKDIAADLQAMVDGVTRSDVPKEPSEPSSDSSAPPQPNIPLARSDNERVRKLVNLDEKFVTDPAEMSPPAAAYFRRRPFLSSEVCKKWRTGYLPSNAGADRSGGTMRGRIVYPMQSASGQVLTWFGRDPGYESKHQKWLAAGGEGREPGKFHFVKGFQRGLELFGQQASRLREPGFLEQMNECGIVVVEGPNDVIALDTLGVPSVGLCSNTITPPQADKLVQWANQYANGTITLMFDCDAEGENGARQSLFLLAQHCRVRLGWSTAMCGGRFRNRQPESLTLDDWTMLRQQWNPPA
jgi:hypothetical protein